MGAPAPVLDAERRRTMQRIPARAGDLLTAIETPALVVDLDPYERNLARMADAT